MATKAELEANLITLQITELKDAKKALEAALNVVSKLAPPSNRIGSETNSFLIRLNSQLFSFNQEMTGLISRLTDDSVTPTPGRVP